MITYLFGAGASKGTIPVSEELVSSMFFELSKLKEIIIDEEESYEYKGTSYSLKELFENFLVDFEWVLENAVQHTSIDTFAKKLFLRHEFDDLKMVKSIMSAFFMIIQSRKVLPDLRYDSFFASILQNDHFNFPNNLRILTWNYDYQFEKAYSSYSRDYRLESCQSVLNIYYKNSRSANFNKDRFSIVKLNGTASLAIDFEKSSSYHLIETVNHGYNKKFILDVLKAYSFIQKIPDTNKKLISSISFAWEDYSKESPFIKHAIEATNQTKILVVIGYSFPFFNRVVDRDIIRSMLSLEKVYFQAPDAEDLKERFLAIRNDIDEKDLIIRKDVKQFVFPNEF